MLLIFSPLHLQIAPPPITGRFTPSSSILGCHPGAVLGAKQPFFVINGRFDPFRPIPQSPFPALFPKTRSHGPCPPGKPL